MGSSAPPPEFGGPEQFGATYGSPSFAPMPPQVPGPLDIVDTVRSAIGLYSADTTTLWKTMAAVVVPLQAIVLVLRLATLPSGAVLNSGTIYFTTGSDSAYQSATGLSSLVSYLVILVSIGAAYRILLGRHLHHPADMRTSLNFGLNRVVPLLWVTILAGLLIFLGLFAVIIGAIYLGVCFSIAIPVLMAEDLRGSRALGRSRDLISGQWWHVFGAIVVAGIVAVIGEVVFGALADVVVNAVSPHSVTGLLFITTLFSMLVSVLFTPFSAAVSVVLYVDMLLRKNDPQLGRLLA